MAITAPYSRMEQNGDSCLQRIKVYDQKYPGVTCPAKLAGIVLLASLFIVTAAFNCSRPSPPDVCSPPDSLFLAAQITAGAAGGIVGIPIIVESVKTIANKTLLAGQKARKICETFWVGTLFTIGLPLVCVVQIIGIRHSVSALAVPRNPFISTPLDNKEGSRELLVNRA